MMRAVLLAAVLLAPAFVLSGYHLFQLTRMAAYAVAVLGLGLVRAGRLTSNVRALAPKASRMTK